MGEVIYLLDTYTVIDYFSELFPEPGMAFMDKVVDHSIHLSIISKIEMLGYQMTEGEESFTFMSDFVKESYLYGLSNSVVEKCISIRKKHKIKLPDAIIAATALAHDLTLITRNTTDFEKIAALEVLNPHELK